MSSKIILVFLLIFVSNICISQALFESCDQTYTLQPGETLNIDSVNYSTIHTPDTCQSSENLPCEYSCRYQVLAPVEFNINMQCEIAFQNDGNGCSTDIFYVNIDGDKDILSGQRSCNTTNISKRSIFSDITFGYTSSTVDPQFNCSFETIPIEKQESGWSFRPKIVGGTEAGVNEFPFMAGLVDFSTAIILCGGVIIHHNWVLTAAHCVYNRHYSTAAVLVGEHDYATGTDSNYEALHTIIRMICHPSYTSTQISYDIALVKTSSAISWSLGVGPACLPLELINYDLAGSSVTIAGWGTTSFSGPISTKLLKASVQIVAGGQCTTIYGSAYSPVTQLCTFKQSTDFCQYESGGPLILPYYGRLAVIGLMSGGRGCASSIYPSYSMRLSPFRTWIENTAASQIFKNC